VSIGVSGGLDSTLTLLVCAKVADRLGLPRSWIDGVTMPGFGTTDRTLKNALSLLNLLGATSSRLDIRQACLDQIKLLNCKPFGIDPQNYNLQEFINALKTQHGKGDLTFENVQARTRTMLLMNRGFVVGTGDMSELALGWCTFNADHMSMYNPNSSIPKTLVKFLVGYAARNEFDGATKEILLDIVDTPISPELLPLGHDGNQIQETEKAVGPYELHDFFLYHFLRYGASAQKIVFLAERAKFDNPWSVEEIRHWLSVFLKRFASQQYKRSTLPDGPKVGTISLSPRGDWRMPSDISFLSWF
jgi:NAD+ synthase (glutamine-hydrolysing)